MGLCSSKEDRVLQTQKKQNESFQEIFKIILNARHRTNFDVDTTVSELIKWGGFKICKTKTDFEGLTISKKSNLWAYLTTWKPKVVEHYRKLLNIFEILKDTKIISEQLYNDIITDITNLWKSYEKKQSELIELQLPTPPVN